jgi:hypothetical protein
MSNVLDRTLRGVFAGRRVFLTGHTGFEGSWPARWRAELGAALCLEQVCEYMSDAS